MELFEKSVALFGYSPDTKELSQFLDENEIQERPEYDSNEGTPMISVEKKDKGYLFQFCRKSDFEKNRGATVGEGGMVLEGLRLHGPLNVH